MRAAIDLVLDRVAWDDVRIVRPQLRARDLEQEQLRAQVAGLDAERCQQQQAMAAAGASAAQTVERLTARVAALESECRHQQQALAAAEASAAQAVERLNAQVAALESERCRQQQVLAAAEASAAEASAALEATRVERDRVQTELGATHDQLLAYQQRLSLTLASTSWRITAPMRALKQVMTAGKRTSR